MPQTPLSTPTFSPLSSPPLPHRFPSTDISSSLSNQAQVVTTLETMQDEALKILAKVDETLSTQSANTIGSTLLSSLQKISQLSSSASSAIQESPDSCESFCESILAQLDPSLSSNEEDYDNIKATLLTVVLSSPPLLTDVSSALSNITLDESIEIAEVSLSIGTVTVALARFVLEKIDVRGFVEDNDALYDRGPNSDVIEYLDDDYVQSPVKDVRERRSRYERSMKGLKKQPVVFWPSLVTFLKRLPLKQCMATHPILATLAMLCLLTPPPFLALLFVATPLVITDTIIHKTYDVLRTSYPDSVDTVEISFGQMLEVLKLYVLLVKIFCKTSTRVLQRQLRRRGGVVGVSKEIANFGLDRAMHPIESCGMVWRGVVGVGGMLGRVGGIVLGVER
jgi:hypothetical protein